MVHARCESFLGVTVDEISPLLESELMLLGRHLSELQRRVKSESGKLERSAYYLLTQIEAGGGLTIKELRGRLGLDDSTLNRQTAAVMRAGLVNREADPSGGIAKKFQLTDSGRKHLADQREAHTQALEEVFGTWAGSQIETLQHLVAELNISLEQSSQRHRTRGAEL